MLKEPCFISGQGRDRLRLVVVVSDEQAHADESQQELEGYDENVDHNGKVLKVRGSVIWRTPNCRGSIQGCLRILVHRRCEPRSL